MPKSVHPIKILASVELGNPAAHCAHFGICSIAVLSLRQWTVFKPGHIRHLKAILSVTSSGSLRFEFSLESMRADTRAQFFSSDGFRVDHAAVLPRSITHLLRIPQRAGIVPGIYVLSLLTDALFMELTLEIP